MDKRWIIPNIGKLELLYLEAQLSEQEGTSRKVKNDCNLINLPSFHPSQELNGILSEESSANSIATDMDIKQYCRAIDLPGFEDNISPGAHLTN